MKRIIAVLLCLTMIIGLTACMQTKVNPGSVIDRTGNKDFIAKGIGYSVSSSNRFATEAGARILEAGGNAIDAAIATAYALAVVEPYASGLGGSGAMVIYDPSIDDYKFVNYMSEAAPSGTTYGNICVPGFVSGMQSAYELGATLPLSEILQPAIEYAEKGFEVSDILDTRINTFIPSFADPPENFLDVYEGDTLYQPDLAETLKTIASEGSQAFYTGSIAQKIIEQTYFTADDLASYKAIVQEPARGEFAGYSIAAASAPFSGTMLIQMLEMMDILKTPDPDNDAKTYLENMAQIKTITTADRVSYLCDPRFNDKGSQYQSHTSTQYVMDLLGKDYNEYVVDDDQEDTTHFSVIDTNGMAVSCTNTLASFFGARKCVAGVFLNNSLKNFTTGVNAYAPGKRPRSFISPCVIKNGDLILAAGAPGGKVITYEVGSVVSDILLYGTNPTDAVRKQRIFVNSPTSIVMEIGLDDYGRIVDPRGYGYYITPYNSNQWFGSVNVAMYNKTENTFYSAPDVRRNGYGLVCQIKN